MLVLSLSSLAFSMLFLFPCCRLGVTSWAFLWKAVRVSVGVAAPGEMGAALHSRTRAGGPLAAAATGGDRPCGVVPRRWRDLATGPAAGDFAAMAVLAREVRPPDRAAALLVVLLGAALPPGVSLPALAGRPARCQKAPPAGPRSHRGLAAAQMHVLPELPMGTTRLHGRIGGPSCGPAAPACGWSVVRWIDAA